MVKQGESERLSSRSELEAINGKELDDLFMK